MNKIERRGIKALLLIEQMRLIHPYFSERMKTDSSPHLLRASQMSTSSHANAGKNHLIDSFRLLVFFSLLVNQINSSKIHLSFRAHVIRISKA